jgi:hypoxanthine phosphoribosyltransferase
MNCDQRSWKPPSGQPIVGVDAVEGIVVLSDGFFDELKDVRLKKEDRIEVVASWGQPKAEHAVLVVDNVDDTGKATVSLMHIYKKRNG